jgi:hypothetical protein
VAAHFTASEDEMSDYNPTRDIAAAIAQGQAALEALRPPEPVAPGCRLASELQVGDAYWLMGRILAPDSDGYMVLEALRVTVVRDDGFGTEWDPFGRELHRFWIRHETTGRQGSALFGPRGVVRVELTEWTVPFPGDGDLVRSA